MFLNMASNLTFDSVVDGPGIRTVIWTQGCPHNCKGCHNPETHDVNSGTRYNVEEIVSNILKSGRNVTFSGGDPFVQSKECAYISKILANNGLNIWAYSGWTFEQLLEMSKATPEILDFLKNIDVLVDGPFILNKRSLDLLFRGSSNQRLIDVKESLKRNKTILKIIDTGIEKEEYSGIFI